MSLAICNISVRRLVLRAAIISFAVFGLVFAAGIRTVEAQAISEGFNDITTLPAAGWVQTNHSGGTHATDWFQGVWGNPDPDDDVFPAQDGNTDQYIAANFQNTSGTNTISNWLFMPNRTFNNGDIISFYTRTTDTLMFPDRLQVRLSTNGASTEIGTSATQVGDFTTVLLEVNPSLSPTGYPNVWTKFTITLSGLAGPTSGRIAFRYFVTNGGPSGANSDFIGIDTFVYTPFGAPTAPVQHVADFNGDGKTDFVVARQTDALVVGQATWFIHDGVSTLPAGQSGGNFGLFTDFFLTGDFDGDHKSDIAVWRPDPFANFYIFQSFTNTVRGEQFGQTGDDPTVVSDYDGDGKTDLAVYRAGATVGSQSFWYYRTTPNGGITYVPWGINNGVDGTGFSKGDFPEPGDFDGDGKADFVVQRNDGSTQAAFWRRLTGGSGSIDMVRFGLPTDTLVPGDYDADGKTDIAVARGDAGSGKIDWYYKPSSAPAENFRFLGRFGLAATDFPVPGDYDGDGKTDVAVWRANADPTQNFFFVNQTTSGFRQWEWGMNGDYPVANFSVH